MKMDKFQGEPMLHLICYLRNPISAETLHIHIRTDSFYLSLIAIPGSESADGGEGAEADQKFNRSNVNIKISVSTSTDNVITIGNPPIRVTSFSSFSVIV